MRQPSQPTVDARPISIADVPSVDSSDIHVYRQMFLGVVLVTLVLALPTGIMGMVARLAQKWSQKRKRPPAP